MSILMAYAVVGADPRRIADTRAALMRPGADASALPDVHAFFLDAGAGAPPANSQGSVQGFLTLMVDHADAIASALESFSHLHGPQVVAAELVWRRIPRGLAHAAE
ncbi:MAG: hypothetical protein JWR84_2736 [Caulobacter sp.]|nr:hypothetical protein [Caulobacter sp.]